MKINDVLNEETYGFDDVKTAASSFLKNLMQGAGIEDAKQYAMRDRAVRMIAKGFQNQWKNIVYDLRRMYEKDAATDPKKGKQNLNTIYSRIEHFVDKEMGASTNVKEVGDAKNTIVAASVDPRTGAFQNPGKLNGADVANAFTLIAANAVTNLAYKQQQAMTGDSGQALGKTGDTYKTKNPNDYGRKLSDPLNSLVDKYSENANWFKNATVPVQVVVHLHIREQGALVPIRYIKLDGKWYQDDNHPGQPGIVIDATTTAKEEEYGAVGDVTLERYIADGAPTPGEQDYMQSETSWDFEGEFDILLWAGPWGIRRQGDIENRYRMLSVDEYKKWATNTGRKIIESADPVTPFKKQQEHVMQLVLPKVEEWLRRAKEELGDV